jgi:hypothetical protein
MDMPTTITARFPENRAEVYHDITLKDAAVQLLAGSFSLGSEPMLLELATPAKKLYYLSSVLWEYCKGMRSYDETVTTLWCDGLYRNICDLVTQNDYQIEAGSLWLLRGNELLLVSDDEHCTCNFKESKALFTTVG